MAFGIYSCQKEQFDDKQASGKEQSAENTRIIYGTLPEDDNSKTHLEPKGDGKYKVVWDENDMIAVRGQEGTATYRLIDGVGTQVGTFEYYSGVTELTGPYTAYSPYTMCQEEGKVMWPAVQTYIAEGMIAGAPMKAEKAADESLEEPFMFKNMGGILRFTLKRASGADAKSVKSLSVTTADKEIYTLTCNTAVEIPEGDKGVDFYIALPVGTYENLHFEFATTGNSRLTLTAKKAISVVRSEISTVSKAAANADWEKEEDLEWIDLGLPSGLLWANKNLGAASTTSQGDYYFWGETTPWFTYTTDGTIAWKSDTYAKTVNSEDNWNLNSNMKGIQSQIDNYFEKYDVAMLATGDGFMPSYVDWQELLNYTGIKVVTEGGVKCAKLTSKVSGYTDKFILLPLAGMYDYASSVSQLTNNGTNAYYMSRTYNYTSNVGIDKSREYIAFSCNQWPETSGYNLTYIRKRYQTAMPVRAVKAPENPVMQFVDLGLPSGTLWADMNLGAKSKVGRLSYGSYYMWGYTAEEYFGGYGVDFYNKWGYEWTGSKFGGKYNPTDGKSSMDNEDDVAWVASGGEYRMPTGDELKELLDNTTQTNISTTTAGYGKINGKLFTSKIEGYKDKSIFVPAAGYYLNAGEFTYITTRDLQLAGSPTGSPYGTVVQGANKGGTAANVTFSGKTTAGTNTFAGTLRCTGLPIRPVKDKK